jgi:AcrR family transcriptional regulator
MAREAVVEIERADRETWIVGAREALVAGGIASVKVAPLAQTLGLTTGSFYWHFKDRGDLLDALLQHWASTNTEAMREACAIKDPDKAIDALVEMWITEDGFCSAYDSAVRDWARVSETVDQAVRKIDRERIAMIEGIFRRFGYDRPRANVRARVMYYHQVGYYAMHIIEARKLRRSLLPYYMEVLRDGVGKTSKT